MGLLFGHFGLGIASGLISALMFVNFDKTWKKYISSLMTLVFQTGGLAAVYNSIGVDDWSLIFFSIGIMFIAYVVAFIASLFVMARLLKEGDEENIIRIRDILLGQKSFIDNYYEQRKREITLKIAPDIDEKTQKLNELEARISERLIFLEQEKINILEQGKKKAKIVLPINNNITVTKKYLDMLPSYVSDVATCINDINLITQEFLEKYGDITQVSLLHFKSYLINLCLHISKDLFRAADVRIHFRYYDAEQNGYKMLVSIKGDKLIERDMTLIPYDKESMISKSCECKRALIKSINPEYDYKGNNFSVWQDYITFSFYNVAKDGKTCLTFGVSVKNAARFQELLYFLSHINFEDCLRENMEKVNDKYNIVEILYEQKRDLK